MDKNKRDEIISAYGARLAALTSPYGRESELPHSKEIIVEALAEAIVYETNSEKLNALERVFLMLDQSVSDAEYVVVQRYEKALADRAVLLGSDSATSANYIKDFAAIAAQMQPIIDRCTAQIVGRTRQLAKLHAIREDVMRRQ